VRLNGSGFGRVQWIAVSAIGASPFGRRRFSFRPVGDARQQPEWELELARDALRAGLVTEGNSYRGTDRTGSCPDTPGRFVPRSNFER